MSVIESIKCIIYRVHEKGLEIFVMNESEEEWQIPEGWLEGEVDPERFIELDPVEEEGKVKRAIAIEGDWHDIPSIRKMIMKDMSYVKDKIKAYLPAQAKGSYMAVKEVVRKVVPGDHRFISELKEIIAEKNLTKYI